MESATKACVTGALVEANYNIAEAARLTGRSRMWFYRMLKKYQIAKSK